MWANPFKVDVHGTREGVVELFRNLCTSGSLAADVGSLRGKVLLCHCGPEELCHADVLVELADELQDFHGKADADPIHLDFLDDGLPVRCGSEAEVLGCEGLGIGGSAEVGEKVVGPYSGAPPRQAAFMGRPPGYEDGGGVASPGRWRQADRRPPSLLAAAVLEHSRAFLVKSVAATSGGKDTPLTFMLKLAAGRFEQSPFDSAAVDGLTDKLQELLGLESQACGIARAQPLRLGVVKALLKELGDPDWEFFGQLSEGVPIGVDGAMPRNPKLPPPPQKKKGPMDFGRGCRGGGAGRGQL